MNDQIKTEQINEAHISQSELNAMLARIAELESALKWYVENDDTYEGGEWEEKNEFWLNGKRYAEKLLANA